MTIELPDFLYAYEALEPLISSATLRAHHGKHHRAYIAGVVGSLLNWEFAERNFERPGDGRTDAVTSMSATG